MDQKQYKENSRKIAQIKRDMDRYTIRGNIAMLGVLLLILFAAAIGGLKSDSDAARIFSRNPAENTSAKSILIEEELLLKNEKSFTVFEKRYDIMLRNIYRDFNHNLVAGIKINSRYYKLSEGQKQNVGASEIAVIRIDDALNKTFVSIKVPMREKEMIMTNLLKIKDRAPIKVIDAINPLKPGKSNP